jgi:hypothetical protein
MDNPPDKQPESWLSEAVPKLSREGRGDGFWLRHGFTTFEEYIEHMERSWDKVPWAQEPREVPEVSPPEFSTESARGVEAQLAGERRSRQVGIRLAPADYDVLAEAAAQHGVASSTLARILTVAGARALLSRTRSA